MCATRAPRDGGFTLVELLAVLVIGAVIYAVMLGVPMRGSSMADLKAAARSLASGLRQAQTTAMATRRDALLTLDVEAPRVRGDRIGVALAPARAGAQALHGAGRGLEREPGRDPFLPRRQLHRWTDHRWLPESASSWSTSTGSRGGVSIAD
jgi:prepilin-type N-terminal cleavage/methylation domain-containing protein